MFLEILLWAGAAADKPDTNEGFAKRVESLLLKQFVLSHPVHLRGLRYYQSKAGAYLEWRAFNEWTSNNYGTSSTRPKPFPRWPVQCRAGSRRAREKLRRSERASAGLQLHVRGFRSRGVAECTKRDWFTKNPESLRKKFFEDNRMREQTLRPKSSHKTWQFWIRYAQRASEPFTRAWGGKVQTSQQEHTVAAW